MKKLVILLIFPLLFSFDTQREDAFQSGEWFKFRVHYGLINAGYATLEVQDGVINNKKVYHVIGKGYSTGMSRFFFKVDDLYESYFDKKKLYFDGKKPLMKILASNHIDCLFKLVYILKYTISFSLTINNGL